MEADCNDIEGDKKAIALEADERNPRIQPVPEAAVGAVAETLKEQGLPAPAIAAA